MMNYSVKDKSMDFVSFEGLFEEIHFTEEEAKVLDKYTCDYDFTSVEKQGPEWIFSLLNVVRSELAGDEIVIEDYRFLNTVFIRILEWLIEGSTYLKCYDGVKLNDSRMLVERHLDEAIASREAIRLIDTEGEGDYVTDKLQKQTLSGYLFKKSLVWITITTIVRFSPRLLLFSAEGFVLLVYHTQNKNFPRIAESLNERVILIREEDDTLSYEGRTEEQISDAVWILGAKLLSGVPVLEELTCLRSMFFRYLYILRDKKDDFLRRDAFNSLLFNQKNPVFAWEDLLKFSIVDLVTMIETKSVEALRNCQGRMFDGLGQLLVDNKAITLSSATSMRFDTVMELEELALKVGTNRRKLVFEGELAEVTKTWRGVFADFSDDLKKNILKRRRPPVGAVVEIRIKLIYNQNPTLAFVSIADDQYEGDGVLHVSHITRVKLDTLEGILHPGDLVMATVVESTEEKLQFSIWEELNHSASARLQAGDRCSALFLYEKNEMQIWLAEYGCVIYTGVTEGLHVEENDCYLLEITDVPLRGRIRGEVIQASEETFDRHDAVANLVDEYLEDCRRSRQGDTQANFNVGKIERSVDISKGYVKELIRLLQYYLTRDVNLDNLNLLYFIRLLSHVLGDKRLKLYHDCLINYLIIRYEFVEGGDRGRIDLDFLEKDFHSFPALKRQWTIIEILAACKDSSHMDDLERYSHSDDGEIANVASYLLKKELPGRAIGNTRQIHDELLALLSFKKEVREEEEILTFGERNAVREFEESIVYPAGAINADVEAQMDVMMRAICGFLNGQGGVIYIGVDDDGLPVGVQSDLDYLYCTPDKYELFLHKRIIEAFGAEIDSLIVIGYRQMDEDCLVFAISVPACHQVVEYDSIVWERQGVELVEMRDEDVKALKGKRATAEVKIMAREPLFPGDETIDN